MSQARRTSRLLLPVVFLLLLYSFYYIRLEIHFDVGADVLSGGDFGVNAARKAAAQAAIGHSPTNPNLNITLDAISNANANDDDSYEDYHETTATVNPAPSSQRPKITVIAIWSTRSEETPIYMPYFFQSVAANPEINLLLVQVDAGRGVGCAFHSNAPNVREVCFTREECE